MNQQFKSFLETSCFSAKNPFECDMAEASIDESDARRELIRKLSFRDNFDFSQETADESGDYFSDIFFAPKRKMTNEMDLAGPSPQKVCLTYEDTHPEQAHHEQGGSYRQRPQMLVTNGKAQAMGVENYPHLGNVGSIGELMEEEFDDAPIVEQFESEHFLMDKVNNLDHQHDPREPHKHPHEIHTIFGTLKQADSPASCLLKMNDSDNSVTFESPAPGKRFNNSSLATCKNLRDPDLRTITPETLVGLMNDPQQRKYLVIDCRFEYEYKGGHIRGAVNITCPEDLETLLVKNRHLLCSHDGLDKVRNDWSSVVASSKNRPTFKHEDPLALTPPILVFHCEFSQKRGPRALRALRNLDRSMNSVHWPNLFYPEVYILENGYKNFHSKFPEYCDPINQYIRMVDKTYKTHYVEAKTKDRTVWKTATKDTTDEVLKPTVLKRFKTMVCI